MIRSGPGWLHTAAAGRALVAVVGAVLLALGQVDGAAAEPRAGIEMIVRTRGVDAQGPTLGRTALGTTPAPGGAVARVLVQASSAEEASRHLRADPGVVWAEPNLVLRRFQVAEPAQEPERWRQWHLEQVNAEWAWAFGLGERTVKVALVDTGVDTRHGDRPINLELGPVFAGGDHVDRDGHGTFLAGTIAAPVNARGTVGLAPGVTVLSLKVDDVDGVVHLYDVYRAIIWAADNGARVVNLSMGMTADSEALREAIAYAQSRDVLVVAAAGNSAQDGNPVVFPAAYPGVLAVGAVTLARSVADYSERGSYLGIVAPGGSPGSAYGEAIFGPLAGGGYGHIAGTSVAAAQVSAAAALVLSIDPTLRASDVGRRLVGTASDLGAPGPDSETGAGLLNVGSAVQASASRFPYRAALRRTVCPTFVSAGGRTSATFLLANVGGATWRPSGSSAVWLAPASNEARAFFSPDAWPSSERAASLGELTPPGSWVAIETRLAAPDEPGIYRVAFRPTTENGVISSDLVLACDVRVVPRTAWLIAEPSISAPATLAPGASARVSVKLRNAGTATWRRAGPAPLRLGTSESLNRLSPFFDRTTWIAPHRPATLLEDEVRPGAYGTFSFDIRAPEFQATYREDYQPVVETVQWLGPRLRFDVAVRRP